MFIVKQGREKLPALFHALYENPEHYRRQVPIANPIGPSKGPSAWTLPKWIAQFGAEFQ